MTCLRPILRALMLVGLSCYSSFALGPTDDASCCLHPDPHFVSFHGISYDYQHGCDNVLVDNPNVKIHGRFVKYLLTMGTRFSYIEGVGIEIPGGDTLEIRAGGNYYYNGGTANNCFAAPITTTIGTLPFSISSVPFGTFGNGCRYEIDFPIVFGFPGPHNMIIEDFSMITTGGDQSYGVSMCINAHGSFFQGSVGMCGEWDAAGGLNGRNGADMIPLFLYPTSTVLNGALFGDEWQVETSDGPFMSNGALLPPASGHGYFPDSCMMRRRMMNLVDEDIEDKNDGVDAGLELSTVQDQRELQSCPFCSSLEHPFQRDNCEYDVSVIGCGTVEDSFGNIYGPDSIYYDKTIEPQSCQNFFSEKASMNKCVKYGGECVRYCDTKDENISCEFRLCKKFQFEYGEEEELLFDRYYNGCACMFKRENPCEDDIYAPCVCEEKVFVNECLAAEAGCEPCIPIDEYCGDECAPVVCRQKDTQREFRNECLAGLAGYVECEPREPTPCDDVDEPVLCDGNRFSNLCEAFNGCLYEFCVPVDNVFD